MSSPCFGRIAWATIPDQRALAHERHPVIIITPNARITPGGKFWVMGVSTKSHLAPETVRTEMQYDPRGTCRSGLREQCWAVSTWLVELDAADIDSYAGTVKGTTMAELLRKIPQAMAESASL
jgi:hypothetical protein